MNGPVVPCACVSQCRAVELELRLEAAMKTIDLLLAKQEDMIERAKRNCPVCNK